MCDAYREACESKRQSNEWKCTDFLLKVPGAAVTKEGLADSLLEHERTHHLISLKNVQL